MKATKERVEYLRMAARSHDALTEYPETNCSRELRAMAEELEAELPKPLNVRAVWRYGECPESCLPQTQVAGIWFDRALEEEDVEELRRVLAEKFS